MLDLSFGNRVTETRTWLRWLRTSCACRDTVITARNVMWKILFQGKGAKGARTSVMNQMTVTRCVLQFYLTFHLHCLFPP